MEKASITHCQAPAPGKVSQAEPGLLARFKDKFRSSCKLLVSSPHLAEIGLPAKHRNSLSQACISERKGSEGILVRLENEPAAHSALP